MNKDQLLALIKKNPITVVCAALCLAAGVGLYFRSDKIPEAEEILVQKTADGERYKANIKNSAQLKEQFDELVAANKEVETRIIHIDQLGTNQQFFYKLESESGVKLISYNQTTQTATKTKAAFTPAAFNVTVQGDMSQVMQFLRLVESRARYGRVLSASLGLTGSVRSAPLTLTLNLELLGVP